MAEKVGFEPTYDFHRNLISSEGRYDHFDTSPYIVLIPEGRKRKTAFL